MLTAVLLSEISFGAWNGTVPTMWGVDVHWDNKPRSGEIAQVAEAASLIRTDLRWSQVEKTKGVYNWSSTETLVAGLAASKVIPLLILDGGVPSFYGPGTVQNSSAVRGSFIAFGLAAMNHFVGQGGNITRVYLWAHPALS